MILYKKCGQGFLLKKKRPKNILKNATRDPVLTIKKNKNGNVNIKKYLLIESCSLFSKSKDIIIRNDIAKFIPK